MQKSELYSGTIKGKHSPTPRKCRKVNCSLVESKVNLLLYLENVKSELYSDRIKGKPSPPARKCIKVNIILVESKVKLLLRLENVEK